MNQTLRHFAEALGEKQGRRLLTNVKVVATGSWRAAWPVRP